MQDSSTVYQQKTVECQGTHTDNLLDISETSTLDYIINIPEYIDRKHFDEWKLSGVSDKIILKNVRTIKDALEVDKLLYRNTRSRWKHSTSLIPCWAVSGVDPRTDEPFFAGLQVKPDVPVLTDKGKLQKYLNPSGCDATPLFLSTGDEGFWQNVINNKDMPIIITEGAKKAGAGLSIGLPSISIPGVSTCRKNGRLHELIKLFAGFGRTIYICFDNDIVIKKTVQNAMQGLSKELAATGSKVMIIELPEGDCKGMDDFIFNNGEEAFKRLVESASTVEEWKKKLDEIWIKQQLAEDQDEPKCKLKRQFEIIRDGWGDGLRLNQMKNQIELGGQQLDLDQIRLHMVLEFGEAVPIGDAQAIVQMLAGQKAYHPVEDYLESVDQMYPDVDMKILDNLATRYFGSDNELHNIYMKKTLLAAVSRVKQPGCRVEFVPILVNPKQGVGKSTFWRNLFGDDWFSDDMGDANEKDERMKLHQFWCLEWSEFENVYKRKDVSALKKFITTKTDSYRTPYSRTIKEYPRRSILVGTTNEQEILADPTGSRRFWVIPVKGKIPVDQLLKERDLLWAAAYKLWKSGESVKLTDEQEDLVEEFNKQFQVVDPWVDKIQEYVYDKDEVNLPELFTHLQIETARQDVGSSKRIGAVLSRLGWETSRRRSGGQWLRTWLKKNQKVEKVTGSTGSGFIEVVDNTVTNNTNTNEVNHDLSVHSDMYPQKDEIYGIRATESTPQEIQPIIFQPDPVDPVTFPTFQKRSKQVEIKKVYLSFSLGQEVRVEKVYPSVKKADVLSRGAIELVKVSFNDLFPVPSGEEWKPECNQLAIYGGELVAIVGFASSGRKFQVEFKSGKLIYVKASALKKPC